MSVPTMPYGRGEHKRRVAEFLLKLAADPALPQRFKSPVFRASMEQFAKAEVGIQMLYDWMDEHGRPPGARKEQPE